MHIYIVNCIFTFNYEINFFLSVVVISLTVAASLLNYHFYILEFKKGSKLHPLQKCQTQVDVRTNEDVLHVPHSQCIHFW